MMKVRYKILKPTINKVREVSLKVRDQNASKFDCAQWKQSKELYLILKGRSFKD
jgi:hypothetical protein